MNETCSLEDAARVIGVGPIQALAVMESHPDVFPMVDTRANPADIRVEASSLQAFQRLYEDACSMHDIADRLGVSVKRIQKLKSTSGACFLTRSFCSGKPCPGSSRPQVQRHFPREDAEAFIAYCESRSIFKLMQPGLKVEAFTYATLKRENIVCASKAYRFKDAVADGFTPQKYQSSDIPPGERTGKLVFKVWGGRSAIQCYFVLETDEFIRLTAFRPHATPWRGFTPKDGRVDFSKAGIEGTRYRMTTGVTAGGAVAFLSAREI